MNQNRNATTIASATDLSAHGHQSPMIEADQSVLGDLNLQMSALPMLTEIERQQLLADWNQTATVFPGRDFCLHQLIEQQALRTPEQPALAYERETLTYRELNCRANQLAQHLRKLGAGPDVIVGLLAERSLEMIVGLLGILKAGSAYLPIDPAFPQERIAFMLSDANVATLITQSSLLEKVPAGGVEAVCLDIFDWKQSEGPAAGHVESRPEDLAYVIYTSGSTGRPKGVCIEHRNIVNYVLGVSERLRLEPGMNHAVISTIAADLGNTVIFPALVSGGCLHVISHERAENQGLLSEYFNREKIDVLKIVPSHLAALQAGNNPQQVMPRRRLILGGEASRITWIERLRELSPNCEIFNHYGPTETTVGVVTFDAGGELPHTASGTLPLGRPLPNLRLYVLDAHLQPVPVGVAGELYIGGSGVARGYLNRSDLTEARFVPDPFGAQPGGRLYRTGDLVRYLPDGNVEFCGRMDDQVKIHGYRIELGEIEGALREHRGVREAAVLAPEDSSGNKQLVGYVVPNRLSRELWGMKSVHILPDGSPVAHLNRNETDYIYNEIFTLQAYLRHGITIQDGDCIVDAGANIGLFTVFASRVAQNLRIISFEPNPAAYACLKANAEAWGTGVTCLPLGLSNENKTAELTFFEGFSLLSGFYADEATEREVVKTYASNQEGESADPEQLAKQIDELLDDRFHASKEQARLVTLSSIIAERGLERIDLLKINVEKSELDVLQGLQSTDWPKIRQMVIEVDQEGNLEPITTLLQQNGYEVLVEQDLLLRKTELCYVYAIRASAEQGLIRQQPADGHLRSLPPVAEEVLTAATLRKYLKERLPQYMVPSALVLMEKFPLTENGKLDRKAFPAPSQEAVPSAQEFIRPQTETEKALAVIWTELLKVDHAGINDDFFELGGHSLLAIRMVSRIRDVFGVDISLPTIFENPTIAGLAGVLTAAKDSGTVQRIERRTAADAAPLSYAQEQLWFLDQLTPGSAVYNMGDIVDFHGAYNAEAMRRAINELVRRHEILRTTFSHSGGQPVQVILPELDLALAELDLSSLPKQEREREWKRVVQEQGRKPFDLSQAPLLRASMVHLSVDEHRLLLTTHHILADEWSMEVVHQEVKQLYGAYSEEWLSPLPELPIQYADFACWQRNWLQGEVLEKQTSYWKEELAGAPFILDMPTDKLRPATQSYRGATETFRLPGKLLEKLKTLSREQQATLFMTLEAGFMALLHRYTGQNDMVVGTPISGRTHSEIENLIGLFLNTVLLRAKLSERQNFLELLQQVRDRALGAYAHPDVPFEHLVAELATERDPSRTPLFQVMFIVHNSEGVSQVSKVSGNRELETGTSKFDLTMILSENENGLDGLIEYSTDLFEAATIRRLAGYYTRLMESIATDPDRSVSSLPMFTEAERLQLAEIWNDTAVEFPAKALCLHELIEEQAARTPDQVALVFEQQTLTYGELNRRANQLAHHLAGLGIGPEALVGLYVERSLEMVVGILGILKVGGAYVPLDPAFPSSRLSYMVADSKMDVLLTHRGLETNLEVLPRAIVRLDSDGNEIAKRSGEIAGLPPAGRQQRAYVLYTSGSTGKPKGVEITHSAIVNFLLSMQREPGFTAGDTLLAVTTLSFDIAGLEIYLPLISGGRSVIASREDTQDPARLIRRMQESGCTVMQATPATWRALIQAGWGGTPNLKVLCGGEAMLRDLADQLLPRCAELWNMYGPTETTVWSAIHRVGAAKGSVPIGKPIANTQLYVLNAERKLAPLGAVGELYIGGDGLARGYMGREELVRERFVASPFALNRQLYRTGDLARRLPSGHVECLGRADNQVKLRGFRIELGEIEAVLNLYPGVRQCAAILREDVPGDKRLVAYIEVRSEQARSANGWRAHLEKDLPAYMIPSAFVIMDKLPLTPNGKIDRKALPAPEQSEAARGEFVAPQDPCEQMLAQIWAKVLKVKRVGRHDNFFELGGHSLMAVRVVVEIEKLTKVRLQLAMLLQAPTIAELAELLRRENWTPSWSCLVPIRPGGSKPPLFLMHAHGGNVLEYYPLANLLGADQPVYALQARGLDGRFVKDSKLEDMAAAYIAELRSLQPEGPYYLGGFCFGGVLALEAAQQLTAAGQEVALLVMIQTMHPEAMRFKPSTTILQRAWYQVTKRISLEADKLSHRSKGYVAARLRYLLGVIGARMAIAMDRLTGREQKDPSRLSVQYIAATLGRLHRKAIEAWAPRPYQGKVVVFRASKQMSGLVADKNLGWQAVFNGNLEVREVPGHQQTLLLEPNVARLASDLSKYL